MVMINNNKKAYYDYEISDKVEAGIQLEGWEVKSVKGGGIGLAGAFIRERNGELFLTNSRIPSYKSGFKKTKEAELRDKKLLVHKNQIINLSTKAKAGGTTLIPLEVYINDAGIIKVLIGLGKGRKKYDKRRRLKERELKNRLAER